MEQQNQSAFQVFVQALRDMKADQSSKSRAAAAGLAFLASDEGAAAATKTKNTIEALFGKEGAAELIDALRGVVIRGFNLNGPAYHHDGHEGHYHVGHDRQPGRRSRRSGRNDTHNQVGHH